MAKRKKNNSTRNLIILGLISISIIAGLFVFKKEEIIEVQVEQIETRTINATVSESGTVKPAIEVKIAPDVSGEIVELKFKEGDYVMKGDLLVTIQPDNYQSALDQAQASLNSAKANLLQAKAGESQALATWLQDSANYARNDQLYENEVISKLEWENAKLKSAISNAQFESSKQSVMAAFYQQKSSKATLEQARLNLRKTNIFASMEGTITQLNVELGERVVGTMQMAGTEILRIADLSRMEVEVEINENDIINIRIGDSAIIEVDAFLDRDFQGIVSEIAYSASVTGLGTTDQITNFNVKVEIDPKSYVGVEEIMKNLREDQSPFRPGMSAQVEIFTERRENVISVPIQAVTIKRSEKEKSEILDKPEEIVYLLEGLIVKEVKVKSGISDDKFIEIKEGLSGDEIIIIGPYLTLTKMLKDEMEVEIQKEEEEEDKKRPWEE